VIPTQMAVCSKGKAMETAARMEKWKNELHVFPLFHKRLENSSQKSRDEFSTVPTASTTGLLPKKREERM
jgi:hypothetical protein